MKQTIGRRQFIIKGLRAGMTAAAAAPIARGVAFALPVFRGAQTPDIGVAAGGDYEKNARQAIELIGGIARFVPRNARVAILANVQSSHPGTFTNGAVLAAAIRLCRQAGAKQINLVSWQSLENWESTGLARVAAAEGASLKIIERDEANFKPIPVPAGKALLEARILSVLGEHDVFINMPVTKDHAGNKFTGTMKNLMGINSPVSNRTFHKENWQTDRSAIEHLDQSIADLNTVVKPTLNLVDATEFITTNGPFGPGEIIRPRKVVAGVDRVAVDAYCASLWGLRAEEVVMIERAERHGLGRSDLKKVKIKEISV
jgi:uncharacterized protein (DUF362 family)